MPFVFTNTFFMLLGLGFLLLSMAWVGREFLLVAIVYDAALFGSALVDYFLTEREDRVEVERHTDERMSLGADNAVSVQVTNRARRPLRVRARDEYPDRMRLIGAREATLAIRSGATARFEYELHPATRGSYGFGDVLLRSTRCDGSRHR